MAMTARQVFEGLLTELSKVNAPSMLLQDFNYFFNKAVNQYINKRYNIYDIGQQTTDDLRVLKATAVLKPKKIETAATSDVLDVETGQTNYLDFGAGLSKIFGAFYEVTLPLDYLHLLNCVCIYKVNKRYKCYDAGNNVQFAAKRLTGDSWSIVLNDFYNRPLPERPYYYIHNVNQSTDLPTNPISNNIILDRTTTGTDASDDYNTVSQTSVSYKFEDNSTLTQEAYNKLTEEEKETKGEIVETITSVKKGTNGSSNLPRTIKLNGITNQDVVEREAGVRYGNPTNVRMEIRYGHDDSIFELVGVFVDYIKAPQTIRLTQEQVNLTADTSQIMEFPDYVCQEIINELVHLVMENTADPRLQTHIPVTQSIATPAQQQVQQPQPQARQQQG